MLSSLIESINPSSTVEISSKAFELKSQGFPVISLSVGEPDFDTPKPIREAAIKAIRNGQTRYTPVGGTQELKSAIVEKINRDNHLEYNESNVIVSCGAKHSTYNALACLLNPQDEVIIPSPYWVSYPDMVKLTGATPVICRTSIDESYKVTAEKLEASITEHTKLVILNSPNNPTGMVYSEDELRALADVLLRYPNIYVISDDIYEYIQWTGEPFFNIVNVEPLLKERTIIINGVSKSHAMTGWRIGYAVADATLIKAMHKLQGQMTTNPCSVSQAAAIAALKMPASKLKRFLTVYQKRHDTLVEKLNTIPGLECKTSQGAFYLFVDITKLMWHKGFQTDVEFCLTLLEEQHVATVPGSAFGMENHLRISYALDDISLSDAIDRISEF